MTTIARPLLDVRQPFTRAQARAAGLTWRHLDGPRCEKLFPGVYIDAEVELDPEVCARAALLYVPEAVAVCHITAAAVQKLPAPQSDVIHLLVPPDAPRIRRRGISIHRGTRRLSSRGGISVTTALETFVDVAADVPLVDGVALGDAIVHEGYASVSAVRRAAENVGGAAGARVRGAAAFVRSGVLSPRETRLRPLMVFSGLAEPVIAHDVVAAGRKRSLDMAYPEWKVAVEYDGRHHVERDLQWSEDIERHEELGDEEWRIVTVTGLQMWEPERVITRIRRALGNAGAPLPPMSQVWRRHFPSRRYTRR